MGRHFAGLIIATLTFVSSSLATLVWRIYSAPIELASSVTQFENVPAEPSYTPVKNETIDCTCGKSAPLEPRPYRLCNINAKAISKPAPPYPPMAKAVVVSGEVIIRVIIDEEGKVAWGRVVSGPALLQPAALSSACQARFVPITLSEKPVKVDGLITYRFILDG